MILQQEQSLWQYSTTTIGVKMRWFKRWLARCVDTAYDNEEAYNEQVVSDSKYPSSARGCTRKSRLPSASDYHPEEFKNPMNITLYNATGGKIIKFHSYDGYTDKSTETTYIVPSDENFEEALGKFIALEAMKHI